MTRDPVGRRGVGILDLTAAARCRHDPHHDPRPRPCPACLHRRRLHAAERACQRHRRVQRLGPAPSKHWASRVLRARLLQRLPARLPLRPVAARRDRRRRSRPRWSARTPPAAWSRSRASSPTSASPGSSSSIVPALGRRAHRTDALPDQRRARSGWWRPAIYLFNPGTIFDSAVWGQIDSVGTLVAAGHDLRPRPRLDRGRRRRRRRRDAHQVPVRVPHPGRRRRRHQAPPLRPLDRPGARRAARPARGSLTSLAAGDRRRSTLLLLPFRHDALRAARRQRAERAASASCRPRTRPRASSASCARRRAPTPGSRSTRSTCGATRGAASATRCTAATTRSSASSSARLSLTWQQVGDPALRRRRAARALAGRPPRRPARRASSRRSSCRSPSSRSRPGFTSATSSRRSRSARCCSSRGASGRGCTARSRLVFFANVYWVYTEDWSFVTDRVMNPGLGGQPMPQDAFLDEHPLHRLAASGCWASVTTGVLARRRLACHQARAVATPAERPRGRRNRPKPPPAARRSRAQTALAERCRTARSCWRRNPADAYLKRAAPAARPPRRAHPAGARRVRARLPPVAPRPAARRTTSTRSITPAPRRSS